MAIEETAPNFTTRIGEVITKLEGIPLWPLLTLARIGVGGIFLNSARLKLQSWEITLTLFRDVYQVPLLPVELAAQLATAVEMGAGILLLAGLFSRLATLPLLGVVAVIQIFVFPGAWAEHATWTALLLLVLLRGPGPLSIDYILARQFGSVGAVGARA